MISTFQAEKLIEGFNIISQLHLFCYTNLICKILINIIKKQVAYMQSQTKSLKNGEYEYSEKDKLGQGSFAKVYKGVITKNGRIVAIRLLPLKLIDEYGQKIKQIITGQVCVLKELSLSEDPDVIFTTRIYDCFITNNNVVMILEFCPGGNLQDIIKKGPLKQSDALEIIYQLAKGLEFIAKQKVVHRDIKPDNVFIKQQGPYKIFKLGDFGFAVKKQINSQIVGTPIFMSPELFRQQNYGSEVDVWAFGLLVHYCLFKQYSFIGASEQSIKKRVLTERYQLKSHQLSKISKQMADFLNLCLKFDKNDRISATKISSHPVFNPVRDQTQKMIKQVGKISTEYESSLLKNSVKGRVSNEVLKYNFLIDLALTFSNINSFNYGSLYMLKHSLGELSALKGKIQRKENFLSDQGWDKFCCSEDYEKIYKILKSVMKKCEQKFENCYNTVISQVKNNFGSQVATGIQKNLGKGPYDQINPEVVIYQLKNSWYNWLQQNKTMELHLVGLELILSLFIYQKKPISFDFTSYEMQKDSLGVEKRTTILEKALCG